MIKWWQAASLILGLVFGDSIRTCGGPDQKRAAQSSADISDSNAVKALIEKVRDKTGHSDRIKAMENLKDLGPAATEASTALCEALLDLNPKIRMSASEALEKIAPKLQKHALSLVIEQSKTNPFGAGGSAIELRKMGDEGKPARPLLWYRYKASNDDYTRRYCLEALCDLFPEDQQVGRQVYLVASHAKGLLTDQVAISHLPRMKHVTADEGVRLLIVTLKNNKRQELRILAIKTLASYGASAASATELLRKAKGESSGAVRSAATESLETIEAAIAASKKKQKP